MAAALAQSAPRVKDVYEVGPSVYVRALTVEPKRNVLWVGTSSGVHEVDLGEGALPLVSGFFHIHSAAGADYEYRPPRAGITVSKLHPVTPTKTPWKTTASSPIPSSATAYPKSRSRMRRV